MGIEDIFLGFFNDLPFKDKLVGETYPLERKFEDAVKVFPVALNTPSTCDNSIYLDLVPDTARMSIIYLEKISNNVESEDRRYYYFTEVWRVVCWLHLSKINKNEKQLYPYIDTMLKRVVTHYGNYGNWIDVLFEYSGMVEVKELFSKYTYDEYERQFLIWPYGAFGLDYNVKFRVARECLSDITIDADLC